MHQASSCLQQDNTPTPGPGLKICMLRSLFLVSCEIVLEGKSCNAVNLGELFQA
jgi:hypothetical protein